MCLPMSAYVFTWSACERARVLAMLCIYASALLTMWRFCIIVDRAAVNFWAGDRERPWAAEHLVNVSVDLDLWVHNVQLLQLQSNVFILLDDIVFDRIRFDVAPAGRICSTTTACYYYYYYYYYSLWPQLPHLLNIANSSESKLLPEWLTEVWLKMMFKLMCTVFPVLY